jgi:adenosine deaminase
MQTTPSIKTIAQHPIRKMIDYGLSVSLCTDNRLMSNTTVSNEMRLVIEGAKLNREEVKRLTIAGFKGSFFHGSFAEKRRFVDAVSARYDMLEAALPRAKAAAR